MFYDNFVDYRKAWNNASHNDPPIPLNIDIELSSICNLTCPFCYITDPSFKSKIKKSAPDGLLKQRFMSLSLARKIISEAAVIGIPALKFNWRGESTLHPNFSEIIIHASKIFFNHNSDGIRPGFFELLINTNGNCNDSALPGLRECTKVMVSLDSLNPETYRKMRVKGSLDKAKSTIHKLIQLGHENIWARRVLTKDNIDENFYSDVNKEWDYKIKASQHYCFDRNLTQQHESTGTNQSILERQYCGYPSQRLIISASGQVYPCCIDYHETMPIGDFNHQTLLEIWNGDKIKTLRKNLRDNKFESDICKNCHSWMAYKSYQRDHVQDRKLGGIHA